MLVVPDLLLVDWSWFESGHLYLRIWTYIRQLGSAGIAVEI